MFERIGEKLSAMAAIPTVSGTGEDADYQIGKYRAFLETAFPSLFASVSVIPVGEALLLSLEGSGRQALPVLFTGHMDVVRLTVQKDGAIRRFPAGLRTAASGEEARRI